MVKRDLYEVLEVSRDVSQEDLKKSWRRLARKYHPDHHPGDKEAEKKFKEIQEAYDILGDPEKRKKYDRYGATAFEPGMGGAESGPFTWSSSSGGTSFDFNDMDLDDLLGNLMGGRKRRSRRGSGDGYTGYGNSFAEPGEDIVADANIPLRKAVFGGEFDIKLEVRGAESKQLTLTIPPGIKDGSKLRLTGQGKPGFGGKPGDLYVVVHILPDPQFTREGDDLVVEVPITVAEAILGSSIDVPTIDGGLVTIPLPVGISSGQRLRIRGKGVPRSSRSPDDRGDLFVKTKIVVPRDIDDRSRELIREFAERNPQSPR